MINATSANAALQYRPQSQALTSDQSSKLTEILSKYDAKNVSQTDAKSIALQVKDLGIKQGKALAEAMQTQGFDAKSIGDMAAPEKAGGKTGGKGGPEGSRPPPPPPAEGTSAKGTVDSAAVSLLAEVIDSYGGSDMTEETWAEAMNSLAQQGVDLSKSIMDIRL